MENMDTFCWSVTRTCSLLAMLIHRAASSSSFQQPWNEARSGLQQLTLNEKDTVCDHICPHGVIPQPSAPKNGIKCDD